MNLGTRKVLLTCLFFVVLALSVGTLWLQTSPRPFPAQVSVSVTELLAGDERAFTRVEGLWSFVFPVDHGAHPDFRTESWYFTGHLVNPQGRRFGFQLAFFRLALAPEPPEIASAWATNQLYRAHLALTEVTSGRFHAFERFSRGALGLSGSKSSPVRVWLENWLIEVETDNEGKTRFRLQARQGDIGIDLNLQGIKSMVLPEANRPFAGGAFHYYLLSRMAAQGTVTVQDTLFDVEGYAWLDRAWGEVPLPRGQIALNRFVLQLDDYREILCFQLRRRDGSRMPIATGLLVEGDGTTQGLGRREVIIEELGEWVSSRDGIRYPARWRLRVPAEAIDLEIEPYVADQEMVFSVRYWSGAVRVRGTAGRQPVRGDGYVELTGYAGEENRT